MAVWSIVDYLNTPGKRFDPEYYQPKYIELANCLSQIETSCIEDFAYVSDGIHNPPVREEEGIPYLTGKCVKENFISLTDTTKISKKEHNLNPRTQVQVGDVLITTTGTIGDAAVVENEILPANTDRDLGIIRIDRNLHNIDPYYLSTFFNCQFGRFQTLRESTGNVQLHLFINKIKKIIVPIGDKFNEIGKLTKQAYDKRRESQALYAEAERLLLQELGLDNLDFSPQTSYVAYFDETIEAKRIDAEYWNPRYTRVIEYLKQKSHSYLGDIATFSNGATPKGANYLDRGIPFLRIQNVNKNRLNLDEVVYMKEV